MKRLTLLILTLLFVAYGAVAFGPGPSGPTAGLGGGSGGSWDANVDITGSANACAAIQNAINPFLDRENIVADKKYRVRITGSADVTWADFHLQQYINSSDTLADAPYRACIVLAPTGDTTHTTKGGLAANTGNSETQPYPVSDGSVIDAGIANANHLTIYWEDVHLRFDCDAGGGDAQDLPAIFYQRGDSYLSGQGYGLIKRSVTERGHLSLESDDSVCKSTHQGSDVLEGVASAKLDSATFLKMEGEASAATEALVYVYDHGYIKPNTTGLRVKIRNTGGDWDNIGLIAQGPDLVIDYNGWVFETVAHGTVWHGNVSSYLRNARFPFSNGTPISIGDHFVGGDVIYRSDCTEEIAGGPAGNDRCDEDDVPVTRLFVENSEVEGTKWGTVVAHDGCSECVFRDTTIEGSSANVVSALIWGAGVCAGTPGDGNVCGDASECTVGTCTAVTNGPGNRDFTDNTYFTGVSIASDTGWTNEDDVSPIFIGLAATDDGWLYFNESKIGIDNEGANEYFFGFDSAATMRVNFDGSKPQSTNMVYRAYEYIRANHKWWLRHAVWDDNVDAGPVSVGIIDSDTACVPAGTWPATLLDCGTHDSSGSAMIAIPPGKWFVNTMQFQASHNHGSSTTCNIRPVTCTGTCETETNWTAVSGCTALTLGTGCDAEGEECTQVAGCTLPSDASAQLGFEVTDNGATCAGEGADVIGQFQVELIRYPGN